MRGWLTVTEYAEQTHENPRNVRYWCAKGELHTLPRDEERGCDYRIPVAVLYQKRPSLAGRNPPEPAPTPRPPAGTRDTGVAGRRLSGDARDERCAACR